MSTRTGLHASMFNEHIICLITHIATAPLFTLCLKQPAAAPAPPPSRKAQSALIGQITHSVIGQLLTAVLEI